MPKPVATLLWPFGWDGRIRWWNELCEEMYHFTQVTIHATVRTLRDLSKLVAQKNIVILAQKRPDGE
jgi:hypothetical protein